MVSVFNIFEEAAVRSPDHPFLAVAPRDGRAYEPKGVEFSYQDSLDRILRLQEIYCRAGYGRGHRVALMLGRHPDFLFHFLALNSLGTSVVPVNRAYSHDEIRRLFVHSDCDLVVALGSMAPLAQQAAYEVGRPLPVLNINDIAAAVPSPMRAQWGEAVEPDDEAMLSYTPGTTGLPKACVLSNLHFRMAGECYLKVGGEMTLTDGAERVYCTWPFHRSSTLAKTLVPVMMTGSCLVTTDKIELENWWRDMVRLSITVVHCASFVPGALYRMPLNASAAKHKVKFFATQGADRKYHSAFETRFEIPLINIWSMTEIPYLFADVGAGRNPGTHCIGKPPEGVEIRIVNGEMEDVEPGTNGELLLRSAGENHKAGMFLGYHRAVEEVQDIWRGGWLHSGDLVRQEEDGNLYFAGRKKSIVRYGGQNIAAAQVEQVLLQNPGVREAVVIGVPDAVQGEEVLAWISPDEGVSMGSLTAVQIIDWLMEHLSAYKAPGYIIFEDQLPNHDAHHKLKERLLASGNSPCTYNATSYDLRYRKRSQAWNS